MAPEQDSRTDRRLAIGLLIGYVAFYLIPLGMRPLVTPDEVRYGAIARAMIASGDWISPHLNGVRYFEKPILGYWINAASLEVFGVSPFALRLPSALATGLTALIVYWLTMRFANRRAALLASAIYLTSAEVFGIGTFAVLDSYLSLFLTAAFAFYYLAYTSTRPAERRRLQVACGCALGCAFLTKGFLGLLIPGMVIGGFLVYERRWRSILADAWIPALAALAVILPWSILIHLREPDFWRYFIFVEHIQRFTGSGAAAQHARPWWYLIALLPVAGFPWIFLAPVAWKAIAHQDRIRGFRRYLLLWMVLPFVFFSVSEGKILTYILPCFAPLAMLLAIGLERSAARHGRLRIGWSAGICSAIFALGLLSLLLSQAGAFGEPVYTAGDFPRFLGMAGAIAAGAIATFLAARSSSAPTQLGLVAFSILPLALALGVSLPSEVIASKAPGAFLASHGPPSPSAILISDSALFNAMSWVLDRGDIYVVGQSEIDYGMSYPDAQHRSIDVSGFQDLLQQNIGRREITIFVTTDRAGMLADMLPPDAIRSQQGKLVFWRIEPSGGPPVG